MTKAFRIVMLNGRFFPVQAGTEIQSLRLSKELLKSGNNVVVLTQNLPGLPAKEIIEGVTVVRLGLSVENFLGSFTYFLSSVLWLLRNRNSFDLMHAHLASATAVAASFASLLINKPALVKMAGSRNTGDIATSKASLFGRVKLLFLKITIKHFVCPSIEIKEEMLKHGFNESSIRLIPNGADTETFKPAGKNDKQHLRQKLQLNKDAIIAIYSGRLYKGKGLEELIDAWNKIEETHTKDVLTLILLGSGELEASLKSRANAKNILFAGWQSNIEDYIRASDIFILPSHGEGLPNSLIEAMSCAVASIATDIGGIREILSDGKTGLLIKPLDSKSIETAFDKLVNDTALRETLGTNARAFVLANLSINIIAQRYIQLYNRIS